MTNDYSMPLNVGKANSSFRLLSTEIYCMIFEICKLPAYQLRSPFTLAGVFSHWRSIVFDIPQLWSSIRVILDTRGGRYSLQWCESIEEDDTIKRQMPLDFIKGAQEWLRRAKGRPLTVDILMSTDAPSDTLVALLDPHISSLEELVISAPLEFFQSLVNISHSSSDGTPRLSEYLHRMDLSFYPYGAESEELQDLSFASGPINLSRCLSLEELSFHSMPLLASRSIIKGMQLAQLTFLSFTGIAMHPELALGLLHYSLQLHDCHFCIDQWKPDDMVVERHRILPSLQSLSLTIAPVNPQEFIGRVHPFFDCLTLPSLDTLKISALEAKVKNDNILEALIKMYIRSPSPAPLTNLVFEGIELECSSLLHLLDRTSTLVCLEIIGAPGNEEDSIHHIILEEIESDTYSDKPSSFLPKLVELFIEDTNGNVTHRKYS